MRIGLLSISLFLTGTPSTKKCLVAPEYDTAWCTALVTPFVLNMVSAFVKNIKLLSWMMLFHACLLLLMLALYVSAKLHSLLVDFITIVTGCSPFGGIWTPVIGWAGERIPIRIFVPVGCFFIGSKIFVAGSTKVVVLPVAEKLASLDGQVCFVSLSDNLLLFLLETTTVT